MTFQLPFLSSVAACAVALLSGCGGSDEPVEATPRPRPVTVLELRTIDPIKPLQITGAAKSWKEQDVAFEISGRIEVIVEQGTNLAGRWEENGTVRLEGEELARLDTRQYRINRDVAAASLEVAKKQLARSEVELEKVLPANLRAAGAERDRAMAEYLRYKQAREDNTVSEVDLIRATADRDARQARYEQAEAAFDTQRAEIASYEANVREAEQKLGDALYDLSRCLLHAPFDGEVSEVLVEAGGFVQAGMAVAHLVMMNPIKVDIAVSSETANRLKYGDNVKLFIPGRESQRIGMIYEKATVADPETRTFRVSIITRNERILGGLPVDDPRLEYPRIPEGFFLMQLREGGINVGPYMVEESRCLHEDAEGHYVWAAPELRLGEDDLQGQVIVLEKFRIEVGERRRNFQGLYLFREVTDLGDLPPGAFLGADVPDGFESGGKVVVARKEWVLRPGQLVQVFLGTDPPEPGLYVPMDALKPIDDRTAAIFVVQESKLRRVEVNIVGTVGEMQKIEPRSPGDRELVVDGARIVADNIHFLLDGETVQAVRVRENGQ